ncbi:MAG: hypothetical protein P1U34_08520 [Coxiellaceae bacterium]|nr:hypothetical protein [Coxiellaceae bacterium]
MSRKRKADDCSERASADNPSVRTARFQDIAKLRLLNNTLAAQLLDLVRKVNALSPDAFPAFEVYRRNLRGRYDQLRSKANAELMTFRVSENNIFTELVSRAGCSEEAYKRLRNNRDSKISQRKSVVSQGVQTEYNYYLKDEMQKLLTLEEQLLKAGDSVKRRRIDPDLLSEIKAFNDASDLDALARLDSKIAAANGGIFSPAVIGGLFASPASAPAPSGDTYDAVFGPYGLFGPTV